jgi:phosphoglycerate dehydrogenase-like enzyme
MSPMTDEAIPPTTSQLRLTIMTGGEVEDDLRARLDRVSPGIRVQAVPYREEHALRNARSKRAVSEADRATAPVLSDEEWGVLADSTIVVALDLPDGLLERAPALRWVQTLSAGTEHLDVDALSALGVVVTSGAGLAAIPIAEFTLGRVLQVWKRFRELDAQQVDGTWNLVIGRQLAGHTLGIVGLGGIGRAIAVRARALGMRVVANRRTAAPGDTDPDVDVLYTTGDLDAMIAECDVVVLAAAATVQTTDLFDRDRLAVMKPGAVLANVARGVLVDEDALLEALRSGHLGAAILDATRQEPLPSDHPLWYAPNCYLSPHISTAGTDYRTRLFELVERNLALYVRGEPMVNVVSPATL